MLKIRTGDFKAGDREKKIINQILESGCLSEGAVVRTFEEKWSKLIGTKYCTLVNSGTSALIAGLHAVKHLFKIKNKAKVITSPLTFIATVNAIVVSGFEPLFADVDKETFTIKPEAVENIIKKEKGVSIILPVHLMGYPADMDAINAISKKYELCVIEDVSQAHGTYYKGKRLGSLSTLACFSFYMAHNIQAGEMGAVVTDDRKIYNLIKRIKAYGRICDCPVCTRSENKCPHLNYGKDKKDFDPRFYHDIIGFNFKTTEFQAGIGLAQFEKVDQILEKRRLNLLYLNKGLASLGGLIQLPRYMKNVSYFAYPVVIKKPDLISRKVLRDKLEEIGIETRPLFGCIPLQQPVYNHLRKKYIGRLPNAEYIGSNGFYIGCHQYLTKNDLDYVIDKFKIILKKII
ncbi:MAG: DegT/DnrJ/EryC1/StrS family aminotransferase [Candidatus Omnitrophota bacterium]